MSLSGLIPEYGAVWVFVIFFRSRPGRAFFSPMLSASGLFYRVVSFKVLFIAG